MPQNLIQPRLQPQVNYLYEIKISSFLKIIDDTTLVQKCYKEQRTGQDLLAQLLYEVISF